MIETASAGIEYGKSPHSRRGLIIAIAFGVLAASANAIYIRQVEGLRLSVLKAKSRIRVGTKISRDNYTGMFDVIPISGQNLEAMQSLVVQQRDIDLFQAIPLAEALEPGQVLFQSSFRYNPLGRIPGLVPKGKRAITLDVRDESSAVAHLVRPGDVVDIYTADGDIKKIKSAVEITAVGDTIIMPNFETNRDVPYRTITVIVPENEVEDMFRQLATHRSGVRLALSGESAK